MMKTLEDHVIIYDNDCPLCEAYTSAFIKTEMLDKNGRKAFGDIDKSKNTHINFEIAKNKIALVDKRTKKATYGIESLFKILGNSMPWLNFLFSCAIFKIAMSELYNFISYNRKVIAPSDVFEAKDSCTPDFNILYRCLYIIFSAMVTAMILVKYTTLLAPLLPKTDFISFLIFLVGQIVFQAIYVGLICRKRVLHYLGNLMTTTLIGALLLVPVISITSFIPLSDNIVFFTYFFIVVNYMLFIHIKRVNMLELHWSVSLSWVVYFSLTLIGVVFFF